MTDTEYLFWLGVFPTTEDGYHFAYTVGGDTSIIVTGLSSSAGPTFDLAMAHANEPDGRVFADGERMVFAPVPDDVFREHCTAAVAQGAVRARQLIWEDDERRWPWDPQHAHREWGGMPVLAGPDWRPVEVG